MHLGLEAGITTVVVVDAKGTGGANDASSAVFDMSADGRFVVFESQATNLSKQDKDDKPDVYLRDLLLETTTVLSIDSKGKKSGNGNSFFPRISDDGQVVAFVSVASNLGPNDTNGLSDVYVSKSGGVTVTVLSPNGGETWPINSTQTIQWSSSGLTGKVKIELSRDGGATWASVANNVANTGSRTWKVKKPATTQARIRVSAADDPGAVDTSNANFAIQ